MTHNNHFHKFKNKKLIKFSSEIFTQFFQSLRQILTTSWQNFASENFFHKKH